MLTAPVVSNPSSPAALGADGTYTQAIGARIEVVVCSGLVVGIGSELGVVVLIPTAGVGSRFDTRAGAAHREIPGGIIRDAALSLLRVVGTTQIAARLRWHSQLPHEAAGFLFHPPLTHQSLVAGSNPAATKRLACTSRTPRGSRTENARKPLGVHSFPQS